MAAAGGGKAKTWCSIPEETERVGILEISELQQWIKALQWYRQAKNTVVRLALIPHAHGTFQQVTEARFS